MNYIKIKLNNKDWKEILQNSCEFIFKNPILTSISIILIYLIQTSQTSATEYPITFVYLYSHAWYCISHYTNTPFNKIISYMKRQLRSVTKIIMLILAAGLLSSIITTGIVDLGAASDATQQTSETITSNYKFLISISILIIILSIAQSYIVLFTTMIIFTKYIMRLPIALATRLSIEIIPRNLPHLIALFLVRSASQLPILPTGLLLMINVICDTLIMFMIIKMFGLKKETTKVTAKETTTSSETTKVNQ